MSASKAGAPPVFLLWGEDSFLLREAALEILGDLQPVEVDAGLWQGGETADLATPSLFGERRALLVSDAKALPEEGLRELERYLEAPDPEAPLILVAVVGERAKVSAALAKLVKGVGSVTESKIARKELPAWMLKRARARELDLAPDGAAALVDTLGEDPGALERALEQPVGQRRLAVVDVRDDAEVPDVAKLSHRSPRSRRAYRTSAGSLHPFGRA